MSNGTGIVKLARVASDAQLALELGDCIVFSPIVVRFFSKRTPLISFWRVDFSIIALRVSNFTVGSRAKLVTEFI